MVKHHTAFLTMFKQMMVGVFGPGMERTLSWVSPQTSTVEVGETSAAQPARDASAQPPLQSMGGQPISKENDEWSARWAVWSASIGLPYEMGYQTHRMLLADDAGRLFWILQRLSRLSEVWEYPKSSSISFESYY
jgi:hypothetical protein